MNEFKNNTIAAVNYIECPIDLDSSAARDLDQKSRLWRHLPARIHALDFKRVRSVAPQIYPVVTDFAQSLRKKNFRLVSISMKSELEAQLTRDGVIGEFGFIRDLKTFLSTKSLNKLTEDEVRNYVIKAIVDSSRRAMETLLGATLAADENFLQNHSDVILSSFHCAAILNSKSQNLTAQFRLYFPKETLFALTRRIVGDADTDEETATSTATELLNMIYGGAKSYLNDEKGFSLPPCIPSLVLKDQLLGIVRTSDPRRCVCIPLASPMGTFFVEIDFG